METWFFKIMEGSAAWKLYLRPWCENTHHLQNSHLQNNFKYDPSRVTGKYRWPSRIDATHCGINLAPKLTQVRSRRTGFHYRAIFKGFLKIKSEWIAHTEPTCARKFPWYVAIKPRNTQNATEDCKLEKQGRCDIIPRTIIWGLAHRYAHDSRAFNTRSVYQ